MKKIVGFMVVATLTLVGCATQQERAVQKAYVQELVEKRHWQIDVTSMNSMRYGSRTVTPDFFLELRGDTLRSYLPYLGQAHQASLASPSQGLNFEVPIQSYSMNMKKGHVAQVEISVKTREDSYRYRIELYETGQAFIHVRSLNRDPISFDGRLCCDVAQGYRLVWSDEFDGEGRPDSTVWNYERGFVRNHEAQWYQPQNAWQHDGLLIIEARREDRPNPTYRAGSREWGRARERIEYTSACLTTRGLREFQYGRLEVCARIPTAGGSWPAIWTLGSGMEWPSCGEIDLMEYYRIGGVPHLLSNVAWGSDKRYEAVWNSRRVPFARFTDGDPSWAQRFHVWRMDWDSTAIRLYLDGELLNEQSLSTTVNGRIGENTNPFTRPQYILLNLALGGDNGGPIDDGALPMRYEIDYVRIYEELK